MIVHCGNGRSAGLAGFDFSVEPSGCAASVKKSLQNVQLLSSRM
jgi:hypothetical protein